MNKYREQFDLVKELIMEASFVYMEYFELWQEGKLVGEVDWHAKIWKLYDFTIKEEVSKLIIDLNLGEWFSGRIDNVHFIDYPDLRGSVHELEEEYLIALKSYTNTNEIDLRIISIREHVQALVDTYNQFSKVA